MHIPPNPKVGDSVLYWPNQYDVDAMKQQSKKALGYEAGNLMSGPLPATVVCVFSPTCVNLRVHVDGPDCNDLWATSRAPINPANVNHSVMEQRKLGGVWEPKPQWHASEGMSVESDKTAFFENHAKDADGNPDGGETIGYGLSIKWQKGPLGPRHDRRNPNGAFVEAVLLAALGRLQFYQTTKFKCRQNAVAITKIEEAIHWLLNRTAERESRGVEGTHEV